MLTDYQAEEENSSASSLKLIQPSQFSWALKSVYAERDFALPACIGSEGINVLLRRIQNRLIDFGYVTTRVVVVIQKQLLLELLQQPYHMHYLLRS